MVAAEKISADYLILPGDVTNRADPDEVALASEIVEKIAKILGIDTGNIAFVPGNHDVDWSALKTPDAQDLRWSQRFDPIKLQKALFHQIDFAGSGSTFDAPYFNIWEFPNLVVVGYNSAHADRPNADHYGLIDRDHLDEIEAAFKKVSGVNGKTKLFLIHHHPQQISDPTPNAPDFSVLVNAEDLLNFAARNKFDFLVHGHRHLPRFQTIIKDAKHPLCVLCAGSFSVSLPQQWRDCIRNQFHLIEIKGRDGDDQIAYGEVKSWAYGYNDGWKPSVLRFGGIEASESFGSTLLPSALKAQLTRLILDGLGKNYITWDEIVEADSLMERVRPATTLELIGSLADELGFTCRGESLQNLILIKSKS